MRGEHRVAERDYRQAGRPVSRRRGDGRSAEAGRSRAAAYDLGGKIVGLSLVLASAVFHSVGLADLLLWGVIGILFQVLMFYLFEWLTPFKAVSEIPAGNVAVAVFASRLSFAAGLLVAALISY